MHAVPVSNVPSRSWTEQVGNSDTAADMRLYVEIGLVPVSCGTCGVEVMVKKNSQKHTSVQWTTDAKDCPEIAAQIEAGAGPGQILGCPRLKASIEDAVAAGVVTVPND